MTAQPSESLPKSLPVEPRPGESVDNRVVRARRSILAIGKAILIVQALALLLAIVAFVPVDGVSQAAIWCSFSEAVIAIGLLFILGRRWGFALVIGFQIAVISTGFFHWGLSFVGMLFLAIWWYVISTYRTLTRELSDDCMSGQQSN